MLAYDRTSVGWLAQLTASEFNQPGQYTNSPGRRPTVKHS